MNIITEVRDGKYLLGRLDHPFHYVGRLPAGPERRSCDNNLACPCLLAPEKQVISSFLIFAESMNAKEEKKEDSKMESSNRKFCLPDTDQLLTWDMFQFGFKRLRCNLCWKTPLLFVYDRWCKDIFKVGKFSSNGLHPVRIAFPWVKLGSSI